jgi:hypothetical protein
MYFLQHLFTKLLYYWKFCNKFRYCKYSSVKYIFWKDLNISFLPKISLVVWNKQREREKERELQNEVIK